MPKSLNSPIFCWMGSATCWSYLENLRETLVVLGLVVLLLDYLGALQKLGTRKNQTIVGDFCGKPWGPSFLIERDV